MKIKPRRLPIIDPREEARVLAWHLGRERASVDESGEIYAPLRDPIAPIVECAEDVRTAEVECIMSEVPA